MSDPLAFVKVEYSFREGWHIFKSADVPGLYVANKDADKAFHDLVPSIELLAKLNDGFDCLAKPLVSYSEFVQYLKAREADDAPDIQAPKPKMDQRFAITERAA